MASTPTWRGKTVFWLGVFLVIGTWGIGEFWSHTVGNAHNVELGNERYDALLADSCIVHAATVKEYAALDNHRVGGCENFAVSVEENATSAGKDIRTRVTGHDTGNQVLTIYYGPFVELPKPSPPSNEGSNGGTVTNSNAWTVVQCPAASGTMPSTKTDCNVVKDVQLQGGSAGTYTMQCTGSENVWLFKSWADFQSYLGGGKPTRYTIKPEAQNFPGFSDNFVVVDGGRMAGTWTYDCHKV